ncbi:MAG: hypothetical protein JSS62_06115 [Verrucomicrobia bacterium]|nr:hypothetical protein [Verrucomicrobiota bacterium]MBS0645774.1 hypothetical protein [Verrucomicrobiota bacterium]
MRKGQFFIIVSLVLFSILSVYSFGMLAKDTTTGTHSPTCYVIFAPHAKLEISADHPQNGQLTLQDVESTVNAFNLIPNIRGKKIPMSVFLTYWESTPSPSLFSQINPAGLVTYDEKNKEALHLNLPLNNPRYDSSKKLLIFDVNFSKDQPLSARVFDQLVLYLEEP